LAVVIAGLPVLLGCQGSSTASADDAGCPAGQVRCASCGGAAFCSPSCPGYECPASRDGGPLATTDAIDGGVDGTTTDSVEGGGCPVGSPTYCTDCEGACFCVAGSCPLLTCPASPGPYPFPAPTGGDAGDAGPFGTIYSQCARTAPRPLTAGSYTDPNTGLTLHWPEGWRLVSSGATVATLSTPITWVPTGSTAAVADDAELSISVGFYGNASQPPQAIQGAVNAASASGGTASTLTLAGQPAVVWWDLVPVPQPGCPAGCLSIPPLPELLEVNGLIQFAMVDGGGGFGVEVDIDGTARADGQPQQVFCDMEAMILGVTPAR
jgi:hypothetical protein